MLAYSWFIRFRESDRQIGWVMSSILAVHFYLKNPQTLGLDQDTPPPMTVMRAPSGSYQLTRVNQKDLLLSLCILIQAAGQPHRLRHSPCVAISNA